MIDEDKAYQATPAATLEEQITNPCIAKNEREWWAHHEIERLQTALNARCPVDAMDRGMSPVEAAVYHVWGERCPDFEPECLTCRAWAEYDENAKLRAALKEIRDAGPMTLDDQRWRIALAALGGE